MSKESWIADMERLEEDFCDGKISLETFTAEMKREYFKQSEIEEIVERIKQECGDD